MDQSGDRFSAGLTGDATEAAPVADDAPGARERLADGRDEAADLRDAHADARDAASHGQDDARGRSAPTRLPDREAARRDRELAAEDRRAAAGDRAAASEELAQAAARIESLMHDHLTGFYQRGAGLIELEREVVQCQRTGEPFTVAFVDVDGLKMVNDAEGHEAGDRLIRLVSDAIRSVLREYDVVVRYGGDEFVCGMQGLSEGNARERFARMEAQLVEGGGGTASVGVAQRELTESLQDVINRADNAMYAAKAQRGPGH